MTANSEIIKKTQSVLDFKSEFKWRTVFVISAFHIFTCYWGYLYAFPIKWQSLVLAYIMFVVSGMGITCGVHRLFTHRTYKATLPLRIWLMLCFAACGQNSIYDWVRDHRLHHKCSDTEADPHNVNRGFWFAHIGWLMMKKNKLVIEKGRQIDMSDIENDPVAMFERKYSLILSLVLCHIAPPFLFMWLCGEEWKCAVTWNCIRFLCVLHSEMTVNSLAHIYGYKPYDKTIIPKQNRFVSAVTFGEGWHNYHHVFPYDYKAAELHDIFNFSTAFIMLWEKMGLAYDLREPTPELIDAVCKEREKTGERSPQELF